MYLFVAIELPEDIKNYIRNIQLDFPQFVSCAQHLHLPLMFLGNVPESEIEKLVSAIKQIKFSPFNLSLSFVELSRTKSKSVNVEFKISHSSRLFGLRDSLIKSVSDQLPSFKGNYSFNPHLKLGITKNISGKNLRILQKHLSSMITVEKQFKVTNFKLFRSMTTPLGKVHQVIEAFNTP